jgi:hypothetical protein
MLKLMKWLTYGVVGYCIYEMVSGITAGRDAKRAGGGRDAGPTRQPGRRNTANMTGGSGEGASVQVADVGGAAHSAKVGRGVVS